MNTTGGTDEAIDNPAFAVRADRRACGDLDLEGVAVAARSAPPAMLVGRVSPAVEEVAMAIKVTHDGIPEIGERCAFCRRLTHYWFEPKDVAVCQPCAATCEEADVPTKAEWLAECDRRAQRRAVRQRMEARNESR
jgi:hypothetical protein